MQLYEKVPAVASTGSAGASPDRETELEGREASPKPASCIRRLAMVPVGSPAVKTASPL